NDLGISFLYITHDLSTAYQISDQIYILYRGTIAECGETTTVVEQPRHPYVQLLVNSIPVPDPTLRWHADDHIPVDTGQQVGAGVGWFAVRANRMGKRGVQHAARFQVPGSERAGGGDAAGAHSGANGCAAAAAASRPQPDAHPGHGLWARPDAGYMESILARP